MKFPGGLKFVVFVLSAAGVCVLGWLIWKNARSGNASRAPLNLWNADNPELAWDTQSDSLSVAERAKIPLSASFSYPLAARDGSFAYDAQPFGAMNTSRNGLHSGSDLNGIGGGNSDLGDPVYAIGNGLVIYAAYAGKGWGNVMVVAHRLPDGQLIQSLYAHLDKILVPAGSIVSRREQIATLGDADGNYLAHLHFEIIRGALSPLNLPAYWEKLPSNRINPTEFLNRYTPALNSLPAKIPDPELRPAINQPD